MVQKIKNKSISFRKNILVLFFVLCFAFSPAMRPAQAWDAIPAALMKFGLETVRATINGIALGIAQQAAVTALNQEVNYLLTGRSTGSVMFVTNWNDFITVKPTNRANVFAGNLITKSLNGRGSLSGYIPANSEGVGANFSYQSQLSIGAKQLLQGPTPDCSVTYQGNPSQMFAGPQPFQHLNLYLFGNNTAWAFNNCIASARNNELQNQRLAAQAEGNAGGGILSKKVGDTITVPGSLIKEQVSKVQNMGIDVISNAQNIPQIIGSAVAMAINQTMLQGIGYVQANVNREITNVRSNENAQLKSAIGTYGPKVLYGKTH